MIRNLPQNVTRAFTVDATNQRFLGENGTICQI
ncbi:hypothetical protein ABAC460_01270 [Asticcacaulis sp. AC460]|nr:hypothetical protein ABAC460_01270 [Asticcacaulis sp. AC460]